MTQSEEIFKWLEDNRDYFKPEGICKALKIDKGNFSKYKAAKSIPEKYITPIMGIISLYGFKREVTFGGYKFPVKEIKELGNKAVFISPPKNAYDSPKIAMIVNDEIGQYERMPKSDLSDLEKKFQEELSKIKNKKI